MKYYILLLPAFLFFFNAPRSPYSKSYPANTSDSLVPFHLIFYYGDEVVQKYEMNVYRKSNKYYAENISPLPYVGKSSDSIWTVELDNDKIQTCIKFINKAKTLPKECEETSSAIEDYTIALPTDTIKIRGNCEWGVLDFFELQRILFQDRISDLKYRRETEIKNLNKKLIGKWYFIPLNNELKRDDYFTLTRSNDFNSACFWEFGSNYSFKNSCNNMLIFTRSKEYRLDVAQGGIFLQIMGGFITDEKGNTSVANYGSTFTLDTLDDNRLKLKFMWK